MRAGYIGVVLAPPTSPLQEEYVLQSLGDRSQDVREEDVYKRQPHDKDHESPAHRGS